MRKTLLCLCCLGLVTSVALADGELQTAIAGARVSALQAARIGPDGTVSDWGKVGPGLRGSERQLIWDCYEPDVEDCTGEAFYGQTIGFRSCGYGEPEDCIHTGSPNCSSRWFYGEGNVNLYTTNDMVFDSAYGGALCKDIYMAVHWYVTGPGSGENCAILLETYEEFDETCNVGDPGQPGFASDPNDPGYIMGLIMNFGYVDSGAGSGYTIFYAEDLAPEHQIELPSDGAGSYNLWLLTYDDPNDPTWPDDYSLATSAQPMLWGTGDHEWINQDTVNRGESCTETEILWCEYSGLPDFHEPNSDDCRDKAVGTCPEPIGSMLALCSAGGPQCPGDVDGDHDTDHSDLGALLAAWCSHEGDPNWNASADLDGDGHVGHGDLGTLLADWGCGT
jgi:hypothetical protein